MPLNFFRKKPSNRLPHPQHTSEPCPVCDAFDQASFDFTYAMSDPNAESAALAKHLVYLRPVKFGSLYQCPKNRLYWYLADDQPDMCRVPEQAGEFFLHWSERWLKLNFEQIAVLREIGGLERDWFGDGAGEIKIPCKITRFDGEVLDPALVIVTNKPPLQVQGPAQTLGRPDDAIEPSQYALPLPVRLATNNAQDESAGYAPTYVSTRHGQQYILNGVQHVFQHLTVKGGDLLLAEQPFKEGEAVLYDAAMLPVTVVYFDEYQGCETLIAEAPQTDY